MDVRGWFGIAMFLAGMLVLIDRIRASFVHRRFLATAIRSEALVISQREFELGSDERSKTGYYPKVQFADELGAIRQVELNTWFSTSKIGQRIPILYQAAQTDTILYAGWDYGEVITKVLLGSLFAGVGAWLVMWNLSEWPRP